MPSTKPCGEVKAPDSLNTVASTATPKTPPTSRMALFVPDACPAWAGLTTLSSALADGAKTRPMPAPAITKAIACSPKVTVVLVVAANHASAPACSASPAAMKPREPKRSERTPAIGATIIVAPVHSSMRTPAWNGV